VRDEEFRECERVCEDLRLIDFFFFFLSLEELDFLEPNVCRERASEPLPVGVLPLPSWLPLVPVPVVSFVVTRVGPPESGPGVPDPAGDRVPCRELSPEFES